LVAGARLYVGIVYVFYGINLFFGINIYAGIKSICPVRTGPIKFILFVNIPGLFLVYSGINRENKFYSNNIMAVTQSNLQFVIAKD
jgi:hypothetical protein